MDTKALRQKILDLAIRGKLVPQDPNDEPASVLLERIRAEKQQMVKDGKLKAKDLKNDTVIFVGDDNLHYEKFSDGTVRCIEDAIPFALPMGWEWTNLSQLYNFIDYRGATPTKVSVGVPLVTAKNVKRGFIDYSIDEYISEEEYLSRQQRGTSRKGDILFTTEAPLGNVALADLEKYSAGQRLITFQQFGFRHELCNQLFVFFLLSDCFQHQLSMRRTGSTVSGIKAAILKTLIIPVPPVQEQLRITSAINSLFSSIDFINASRDKLKVLVNTTKSKILDLAIRGKLVSQDPNDEPASVLLERIRQEKEELIKTGKIKRDKRESVIFRAEDNSYYEKFSDGTVECIREEIPFAIPKNWNWVRLENICYNIYAGGDKPSDFVKEKDAEHSIPIVANGTTNEGIMGFTKTPTAQANTITIAGRGTIGFPVYRNYEYCPIVRLLVINQCNLINPLFLYYYLYARRLDSVGSSIPQLTVPMVKPKLIPLPPLKEQQNIVNRIIELLSVIESIDANLM